MKTLPSRLVVVWLALVAATVVSWALGAELGSARNVTALLFVIAFAKVWLIGRYFMDLRSAAVPLRRMFDGWVLVVATALTAIYLIG